MRQRLKKFDSAGSGSATTRGREISCGPSTSTTFVKEMLLLVGFPEDNIHHFWGNDLASAVGIHYYVLFRLSSAFGGFPERWDARIRW